MKTFSRLAAACTAASLIQVVSGAVVRATSSGLGCADSWPSCKDTFAAPTDFHGIIEYSHRFWAVVVIVLVAALVVTGLRARVAPNLRRLSFVAVGLIFLQAAIGGMVVKLNLQASAVSLHYFTALGMSALLTIITVKSLRPVNGSLNPKVASMTVGAVGSVASLLIVGLLVRERGAGLAFSDFPLMNGSLLPNFAVEGQVLMWLHRLLAFAVLGHVIATWSRCRKSADLVAKRAATFLLAFVCIQILFGVSNVMTELASWAIVGHVVFASAVWCAAVALAAIARTMPSAAVSHDRVAVETL